MISVDLSRGSGERASTAPDRMDVANDILLTADVARAVNFPSKMWCGSDAPTDFFTILQLGASMTILRGVAAPSEAGGRQDTRWDNTGH